METYNFLNRLDVSYLHVFTYSERDNTEAVLLKSQIPMNERKRRNKMLRILSEKKLRAFYERFIGTDRKVLFESENKNGFMFGYTENYLKVKMPYDSDLSNRVRTVRISGFESDGNLEATFADEVAPSL
jgi:threonylcarbamoyladenosine tRNA methylthiotransferase MtaB